MLVDIIEGQGFNSAKRNRYLALFLIALAAMCLISAVKTEVRLPGAAARELREFDVFYLAGSIAGEGHAARAYDAIYMLTRQTAMADQDSFMPWTYPPQFTALARAFAAFPSAISFSLFIAVTSGLYLWILRRISGAHFYSLILLSFPMNSINISCGQNGFLTGALMGAFALATLGGRPFAGAYLGALVIKPHFGVIAGLQALYARRWTAVCSAVATVAVSSAIATAILGIAVWPAFLQAVKTSSAFLQYGDYPLFRMVSAYAAVRTLGAPAVLAMGIQLVVAVVAVVVACKRYASAKQSAGVVALTSVLVSPYAYDYDLPLLVVGLALLFPDIVRLASRRERATLYILFFVTGWCGIVAATISKIADATLASVRPFDGLMIPSFGGITLLAFCGLTLKILMRDRGSESESCLGV